ncbi:hypothetical protein LINGRAHAP2_LOCUS23140 [Linum grandiflorum]
MAPPKHHRRKTVAAGSSRRVSKKVPPVNDSDDDFQVSIGSRRRTRSSTRREEAVIRRSSEGRVLALESGTKQAETTNMNLQKKALKLNWLETSLSGVAGDRAKKKSKNDDPKEFSEDDSKNEDKNNTMVVRTRCSPNRIIKLVSLKSSSISKIGVLAAMGFGGTTKLQIDSMCEDFNRWALEAYDVANNCFYFINGDPLIIIEDEVERVYGIPRGNLSVNDAVAPYKSSALQNAARRHHIGSHAKETVQLKDLKFCLDDQEDQNVWKNLMVLFIIAVLLCPRSHLDASLRYLPLLGKSSSSQIKEYNWCQIVEASISINIYKQK